MCKDCSTFDVQLVSENLKQVPEELFDPFFIRGGPIFVERPSIQKSYEGNIFSQLANKLYSDFDLFDIRQVLNTYSAIGPQESLDTLFDFALGDLYFY